MMFDWPVMLTISVILLSNEYAIGRLIGGHVYEQVDNQFDEQDDELFGVLLDEQRQVDEHVDGGQVDEHVDEEEPVDEQVDGEQVDKHLNEHFDDKHLDKHVDEYLDAWLDNRVVAWLDAQVNNLTQVTNCLNLQERMDLIDAKLDRLVETWRRTSRHLQPNLGLSQIVEF